MSAIGYVTKQADGNYKGSLRTLTIKAGIEIVANNKKYPLESPVSLLNFRVFTDDRVEIGAGWHRTGRDFCKN